MNFTISELRDWDEKIVEIVDRFGLDYYPQEFEICSFEDMIGYEAYAGMPSRYPHWSFGKSYEMTRTLYKYNLQGLPYEMVINSNPCLAYLMKDNSLLLQILTIAHVYGHNDFFKNNRLFKEGTRADYTIDLFKNHADRIRGYISDPSISYERVERIIDAAHAVRYQTSRVIGERKLSREEQKQRIIDRHQPAPVDFQLLEERKKPELPDLNKIPLEPEEDILGFIATYGDLEAWEKDLIQIVSEEMDYFIPQIETKIMNEGWASFWHYRILNELDLPQGLHIEFLKRHNQVIRPLPGRVNPYYVGFKIFEDIERRYPDDPQKIFEVREMERDESFIRKYLTFELVREMNLFKFDEETDYYVISEVADEAGWKEIRNAFASSVGFNRIPVIKVVDVVKKDNTLVLEHEFQGQELELNYASETLKYLVELWGSRVYLKTFIEGSAKVIVCSEDKRIRMESI